MPLVMFQMLCSVVKPVRFLSLMGGNKDPTFDHLVVETLIHVKNQQLIILESMDTQKSQPEKGSSSTATAPVVSCRKKKNEEAAFLEDLKDHIDEFISASVDDHKSCFKKTIHKMFGLSKAVTEGQSNASKEVESSLALRTTVQD
ncbi:hypothetical protein VNO80_26342 [Phaseolus coccineus]|uniref:Uncharacterized protein n=1 Tax=Phaseolus coccineus TaxID=3886 RepID=A0AAN9LHT6_PHACN